VTGGGATSGPPNAWPPVGKPAPPFALSQLQDPTKRLSPADMKGKVWLVDFAETCCKPGIAASPGIQKLHEKLAGKNVAILGIAIDEEGTAKVDPFLKKSKTKYTYPMLIDASGETWKAWGVKSIPFLALVKDGQIIRQWSSYVQKVYASMQRAAVPDAMAIALAGPKADLSARAGNQAPIRARVDAISSSEPTASRAMTSASPRTADVDSPVELATATPSGVHATRTGAVERVPALQSPVDSAFVF